MKNHRNLRDTSAISTIVANLLMVIIVASLGATLFIWSNATYGTLQSQTDAVASAQAEKIQERYAVEHVRFTDANGNGLKDQVTLYVRNVGDLSITLVDVYVNSTRVSTSAPVVGPGVVVPVTIQLSPELPIDNVLSLAAVTQRGNAVQQNWIVT